MYNFSPSDIFLAAVNAGFEAQTAHALADLARGAQKEARYELYKEVIRDQFGIDYIKTREEFDEFVNKGEMSKLFYSPDFKD